MKQIAIENGHVWPFLPILMHFETWHDVLNNANDKCSFIQTNSLIKELFTAADNKAGLIISVSVPV